MTLNQKINWQELIAERKARGIAVDAFCKEKGVSKSKFYAMAHLVAKAGVSPQPSDVSQFVEVQAQEINTEQHRPASSYRVLTITTAWGCIEVPL